MKTSASIHQKRTLLIWLLLGTWVVYSAAMLWNVKMNTFGAAPICHYIASAA